MEYSLQHAVKFVLAVDKDPACRKLLQHLMDTNRLEQQQDYSAMKFVSEDMKTNEEVLITAVMENVRRYPGEDVREKMRIGIGLFHYETFAIPREMWENERVRKAVGL